MTSYCIEFLITAHTSRDAVRISVPEMIRNGEALLTMTMTMTQFKNSMQWPVAIVR